MFDNFLSFGNTPEPTIDSAIQHFTTGIGELRTVEDNAIQSSEEKKLEAEKLLKESRDENATAERAGRIADRLEELLS